MVDKKKTDECYALDSNTAALDCMKALVQNDQSSCVPKLVLFTQEGCVPCEEEKALRQGDINKGIIREVSIDTREGLAIAAKNEIHYFLSQGLQ